METVLAPAASQVSHVLAKCFLALTHSSITLTALTAPAEEVHADLPSVQVMDRDVYDELDFVDAIEVITLSDDEEEVEVITIEDDE